MFAVGILKLAGDIRFELMMTISKTVALGQLGESPTEKMERAKRFELSTFTLAR